MDGEFSKAGEIVALAPTHGGQAVERADAVAPVMEVEDGDGAAFRRTFEILLEDVHEALGIGEGQGPPEDGFRDAEQHSGRSNAEGHGEDGEGQKAGSSGEGPKCQAQFLNDHSGGAESKPSANCLVA